MSSRLKQQDQLLLTLTRDVKKLKCFHFSYIQSFHSPVPVSPCLSFNSHVPVWSPPLSRAVSLHTHAFGLIILIDNSLCKAPEADSSLNHDRGKLATEVMLFIPSYLTRHKHADWNQRVKVFQIKFLCFHFFLFGSVLDQPKHYESMSSVCVVMQCMPPPFIIYLTFIWQCMWQMAFCVPFY